MRSRRRRTSGLLASAVAVLGVAGVLAGTDVASGSSSADPADVAAFTNTIPVAPVPSSSSSSSSSSGSSSSPTDTASSSPTSTPTTTPAPGTTRPNVVMVLTDDLSWNLVRYMPHVQQLMQQGMTFSNYTVTDSLCCPSRASIFTGKFPHNTQVLSNTYPTGGFGKFAELDEHQTFATSLQSGGYVTGFAGKYLNQYDLPNTGTTDAPSYNRPGWTAWAGVNGGGYGEFNYTVAFNKQLQHFGTAPGDYMTTELQQLGTGFVDAAAHSGSPFLLELASFAPHAPYVPSPADRGTFPRLRVPRTPAWDTTPLHAPSWLLARTPLGPKRIHALDTQFEQRVESVQAVDRMIGALEQRLVDDGVANNTYIVFSSDNGYHMGDYRLFAGKQTPYDTDVRVPLIVTGPGVPAGVTNPAVTENIDLAPTFEQLAGRRIPADVDGHSLVPLLHGGHPVWRTLAGIEHVHPPTTTGDPDAQDPIDGTPPTYQEVRSATFAYVQYVNGEHEYYDLTTDPWELVNVYDELTPARKATLTADAAALSTCVGRVACWAAGKPELYRPPVG